jgi:predicted nucleotidyltransferase
MSKRPHTPQEVFQPFQKDMLDTFGGDVEAIYLYGSGARGDYHPKRSDINFLVVLGEEGMDHIERAATIVRRWAKRGVAMPLFLTRDYINTSLDSFPIEFLNIKLAHTLVYGADFLDELDIDKEALRLQCEEQVKSKLLHLRDGVLAIWDKKAPLREFLALTIPTFLSLFRVLLAMYDHEPPKEAAAVFQQAAELYHLDESVFEQLMSLRRKSLKLNLAGVHSLAKSLIAQIKNLSEFIDQWKSE